jgi:hypothetical protein
MLAKGFTGEGDRSLSLVRASGDFSSCTEAYNQM